MLPYRSPWSIVRSPIRVRIRMPHRRQRVARGTALEIETELHEISLSERTYDVCGDCFQRLVAQIEEYHWWDRPTEAHYNRAVAFLQSLDAVWCVKDQAYAGGELWVHTPYCDVAVV